MKRKKLIKRMVVAGLVMVFLGSTPVFASTQSIQTNAKNNQVSQTQNTKIGKKPVAQPPKNTPQPSTK